jgi:hypothetical protein
VNGPYTAPQVVPAGQESAAHEVLQPCTVHAAPLVHIAPQNPQLFMSLARSTQTPLQQLPVGQSELPWQLAAGASFGEVPVSRSSGRPVSGEVTPPPSAACPASWCEFTEDESDFVPESVPGSPRFSLAVHAAEATTQSENEIRVSWSKRFIGLPLFPLRLFRHGRRTFY